MSMFKTHRIGWIAAGAALAVLLAGCAAASQMFGQQDEFIELTILHTAEIRGNITGNEITAEPSPGSAARSAAYIASQREHFAHVIAVDLGNMVGGSLEGYHSSYVDTASEHLQSRLMREIGYDAVVMGNRDIGLGTTVYQRIRRESEIPWLGANIISRSSERPHIGTYRIVEAGGAKVALLGLSHPDILAGIPDRRVSGVGIDEMKQAARYWVEEIREEHRPDVIIGMIHALDNLYYRHVAGSGCLYDAQGYQDEVLEVAREVPGLDAVLTNCFSGHEYRIVQGSDGREVHILSIAGADAVGTLRMTLQRSGSDDSFSRVSMAGEITSVTDKEPSSRVLQLAEPYQRRSDAYARQTVGELDTDLLTREAFFSDTPLMELIHQAQLSAAGAHISFASIPAYDTVLEAGAVEIKDLFSLISGEVLLYSVRMTGEEIRRYLEYSYGQWFNTMRGPYDHLIRFGGEGEQNPKVPFYQFDSAKGIDYQVDITREPGNRITITGFSNGRSFRPQDTYIVVLNSYRAAGGGGHLTEGARISEDELSQRIMAAAARDLRHHIIRFLEQQQRFVPPEDPTWKAVPESWAAAGRLNDYSLLFDADPRIQW